MTRKWRACVCEGDARVAQPGDAQHDAAGGRRVERPRVVGVPRLRRQRSGRCDGRQPHRRQLDGEHPARGHGAVSHPRPSARAAAVAAAAATPTADAALVTAGGGIRSIVRAWLVKGWAWLGMVGQGLGDRRLGRARTDEVSGRR